MKNKKFNVIDILAVMLILAVVAFAGTKLLGGSDGTGAPAETMAVTYIAQAQNVDARIYDTVQDYLPAPLMASGNVYDGQVVSVEKEPCYVLSAEGDWVEDPLHVSLLFTVEASIPKQGVMTTEIAKQEVRIGRKNNILKTEYMEFTDCTIVDVTWGE